MVIDHNILKLLKKASNDLGNLTANGIEKLGESIFWQKKSLREEAFK